MDALGIRIWLYGGWAVDARLGRQTRRHADVDIAIEQRDVAAAVEALEAEGHQPVPWDDTTPWNFVLGDEAGRQVDFYVRRPDGRGRSGR